MFGFYEELPTKPRHKADAYLTQNIKSKGVNCDRGNTFQNEGRRHSESKLTPRIGSNCNDDPCLEIKSARRSPLRVRKPIHSKFTSAGSQQKKCFSGNNIPCAHQSRKNSIRPENNPSVQGRVMSTTGSERRKVDANYNDVARFQMVHLGILGKESPDFNQDPESLSICPLLTPSPTGGEYQSADPLSAALEQKMLLEGKTPSPDFAHDEETALLATFPSVSYTHPLDPLRNLGFERQNTSSSLSTEVTGASSHPLKGTSEVPYTELDLSNAENISGGNFLNRGRNSLPSEVFESSASSSSFALHENISSTQLLANHYKSLESSKINDVASFIAQETCTKKTSLGTSGHKLPPDYAFLSWNWPLIRKSCFWTVISAMIACVCIVVAMLATVPRRCLPPHAWYQGTVFYEIFPASFQDSGRDGIGDLRGIAARADYFAGLGVKAIRLNSVFPASHYPENFDRVTNLTDIERVLGDFKDFRYMLNAMKERNISVILDFPVHPYVKDIGELKVSVTRKNVADKITNVMHNHRSHRSASEEECLSKGEFGGLKRYLKPYIDGGIAGLMKSTSDHLNSISQSIVEEAIEFWFENGVDGVYLKGLEHYLNDGKFLQELKKWRNVKESFRQNGEEKMLMCDYKVLSLANEETASAILSTMDLLDVFLDVANGTTHIKTEVSKYQQSRLFDRRDYPWIHWNIGNVGTKRLASKVENNLGAILFQFLLPGTISIFYGDEIGLTEIHDPHFDHTDVKYVHHLAPMKWQPNGTGFTRLDALPWLPFAKTVRTNNIHEKILSNMTYLRNDAPSIYMNSIWKEQEILFNFAFRYSDENIVVLERSYPRRNAYVVVFNAGSDEARNDLSNIYYGGELVEDSRGRSGDYVNFNLLRLGSGEACVIRLDK